LAVPSKWLVSLSLSFFFFRVCTELFPVYEPPPAGKILQIRTTNPKSAAPMDSPPS
jgi:hypothetical protein